MAESNMSMSSAIQGLDSVAQQHGAVAERLGLNQL
jgi:hypothetical protein